MEIVTKKIEDLHGAEYNPRVELKPGDPEFEKIARSIEAFGYVDPVIINRDGTIIGGHQRCAVLKSLGYTEIKCVQVDFDKNKEKACNIALNKITGAWDEGKLKDLLIELEQSDYDATLTGFDDEELTQIIGEVEVKEEAIEDDFDEDSEPIEPQAKIGQIYQLGEHRLMCGDSTSMDDVAKLMDGEHADLFITDPPYNVDYESTAGKIMNDKQQDGAFREFLIDVFKNADSAMKPCAAFYIWHSDIEGYNFRGAIMDAGWQLREVLIWVKSHFVIGRLDYHYKHEPCLYGWKAGAGHYFINKRTETSVIEDAVNIDKLTKDELKDLCKKLLEPDVQTTVIKEQKPVKNDIHPTMKPVKLFSRLIINSSKQNQNVLDLFGGSGTTMIACEQLNRRSFLMELDPHYVDVIIARWEKFTGKKAELIAE